MPSKNNPDTSGYFHVNFIPCLIALLITQSAHREYSSVNGINDIYTSIDESTIIPTPFFYTSYRSYRVQLTSGFAQLVRGTADSIAVGRCME